MVRRRLEAEYPCLDPGPRHEKVRGDAVVRSRAMQVAIGIYWESRGDRALQGQEFG